MPLRFLNKVQSISDLSRGERIDSKALIRRVLAKASGLKSLGFLPGDRALLTHSNSIEFFCDLFAIWICQGAAVPLHPSLTDTEISNIESLTGARILIFRDRRPTGINTPSYHTIDDFGPLPSSKPTVSLNSQESHEALILFSSGTDGLPKGISISNEALKFRLLTIQQKLKYERIRKTLCFLPTGFGHGLIGNCLAPLFLGGELNLLPEFNTAISMQLSRIINDEKITFFSSVPSVWKILERTSKIEPHPSLELVHCASSPLSLKTWSFAKEWTGVKNFKNVYGLTEMSSWVGGTPDDYKSPPHDGFVGELWGTEARIRSGEKWVDASDVEGEIFLKSPGMMTEYINHKVSLIDGFFPTGDLGYFDENKHLSLVGRISEVINKGGIKISPQEIKICLEKFLGIEQAYVCAVEHSVSGQAVAATIVPSNLSTFNLEAVKEYAKTQLASYKWPSKWLVLESLPTNRNGKVDRKKIQSLLS